MLDNLVVLLLCLLLEGFLILVIILIKILKIISYLSDKIGKFADISGEICDDISDDLFTESEKSRPDLNEIMAKLLNGLISCGMFFVLWLRVCFLVATLALEILKSISNLIIKFLEYLVMNLSIFRKYVIKYYTPVKEDLQNKPIFIDNVARHKPSKSITIIPGSPNLDKA